MSDAVLTPAQEAAHDGLLAVGQDRPPADPLLAARLLDELEEGIRPAAQALGVGELVVTKHALGAVLQCEGFHEADAARRFQWTPRTALGTVAHKAIELANFAEAAPPPLVLVDWAIERFVEESDDWTPGRWLAGARPAEVAELRASANARVASFFASFPPLRKAWTPVHEAPLRVDLCDRRVSLRGRVDLMVGKPTPGQARVLLIDLKTGAPHHGHVDELRYYALLETIRHGLPPFRVASYYLDAARWQHEDVDEAVLASAARRVVDAVGRLAELATQARPVRLTPGLACGWCPARTTCPAAVGADDGDDRDDAHAGAA